MKSPVRIILISLCLIVISGCKKEAVLLDNIDQYRSNRIISSLQKYGIESSKISNKKGDAYSIRINSEDLANASAVLASTGPYTPAHSLQSPCELKGLIATPSEERACRKFRLEASLEDTLSQIDGAISTEVHIVMSDTSSSRIKRKFLSSSAAIFIKHRADITISHLKTNIKRLVEKSIPGLTYDKVSLVLIPAIPMDRRSSLKKASSNASWLLSIMLLILLIATWIFFFFKEKIINEFTAIASKRTTIAKKL